MATQKHTKKDSKIAELTKLLKHVQAHFENYRKRKEAESLGMRESGMRELTVKLLPVLDSFELALKSKPDKGLELIYSQFLSILESAGLREITEKSFDPRLHEALLVEKSTQPNGTILEVLQKGYKFNDTVIRTAKVKVAKC